MMETEEKIKLFKSLDPKFAEAFASIIKDISTEALRDLLVCMAGALNVAEVEDSAKYLTIMCMGVDLEYSNRVDKNESDATRTIAITFGETMLEALKMYEVSRKLTQYLVNKHKESKNEEPKDPDNIH